MMVNILCLEAIAMEIIASIALMERNASVQQMYIDIIIMSCEIENESRREKTGFLHMRKQRRRSAAQ